MAGSTTAAEAAKTATEQPAAKKRVKKKLANKVLGQRGEDAAARFLYRRGYDIVARNWTCGFGEADIIARDGESLVFIEVKTRSGIEHGFPSEAVDAKKRDRYERIALAYLSDCEEVDVPVRFDVVAIVVMPPDRALIRHHIGAFSVAA